MSTSLFANGSLQQIVSDLQNESYQAKPQSEQSPLLIQQKFFNTSLSDYQIYREDKNHFNIVLKGDYKYQFHITSINGNLQGIALDTNQNFGYKITIDPKTQELLFTEERNENIDFKCGGSHSQPKPELLIPRSNSTSEPDSITKPIIFGNPLLLESKPGASHLIYLDYDGEEDLEGWGSGYIANGVDLPDSVKHTLWEVVAEDFQPWDVNVTTNRELFDSHSTLKKIMVVVADFGYPSWVGLASLSSYGTGKPVLVDVPTSLDNMSDLFLYTAASHEVGHALSLNHDGGTTGNYYSGHGEFSPIMGNGGRPVSVWSKGGYPSATNFEDDIQIISDLLTLTPDDYHNHANLIIENSIVNNLNNKGIIGTQSDLDTFKITLSESGDIKLKIGSPLDRNANLDIKATLINSTGEVLETSHPSGERSAYIDQAVNSGEYYLIIDGTGELTTGTGFNDYGSLGAYEITGFAGFIAPQTQFSISPQNICLDANIQLNNTSIASEPVYEWTFEGADIPSSNEKNPTLSFTTPGEHTVKLKTTNKLGTHESSQTVQVGNIQAKINFPMSAIDSALKGSIHSSQEVLNFTYADIQDTAGATGYIEACLMESCYEVQIENLYTPETCGEDLWSKDKSFSGSDKAYYNGYIYTASWWSKGDTPSRGTPWVKGEACNITNDTSLTTITDMDSNEEFYQTSPVLTGIDLGVQDQFCTNDNIIVSTQNPIKPQALAIQIHSNLLIIDSPQALPITQASLFNTHGQKLKSFTLSGNQIDISDLEQGIYFIRLQPLGALLTTQTHQFVKN